MQINITTECNIGDILYLQQTNGGGLRKVQVLDIYLLADNSSIIYVFNRPANIHQWDYRKLETTIQALQANVISTIRYIRRGDTWLTEKPPKKRKPMTETSKSCWEQAATKIFAEWGM